MTTDQKRLVSYALNFLASNVDYDVLEDLGRSEIDELEHGTEDSGFTDDEADALLDFREEQLASELRTLAERLGGE